MQFTLNPYIAAPIVVIALAAAILIWYALVRPVPETISSGVITDRTFRSEQIVEKSVPRSFRNIEHYPLHKKYTLPDRCVYQIRLEDKRMEVSFSMPAFEGQELAVGQRVQVVYIERSIPFLWEKIYVKSIDPL